MEKRYVLLDYDSEYQNRWETILPAGTTLDMAKGYAQEEANRVRADHHRVELTYLDCEIEEDRPKYSIGTIRDKDGYNPIDYRPLPLYIYRGKVGVIHLNEFLTEEQAEQLGLTAKNCELCYDDDCNEYGGIKEIIYQAMINYDDDHRLVNQWVSVETANKNYIRQQYLIRTDIYYDWNSRVSRCVDMIENSSNDYDIIKRIVKAYLSQAEKEVMVYSDIDDVIHFLIKQFSGAKQYDYVKEAVDEWRAKNDIF